MRAVQCKVAACGATGPTLCKERSMGPITSFGFRQTGMVHSFSIVTATCFQEPLILLLTRPATRRPVHFCRRAMRWQDLHTVRQDGQCSKPSTTILHCWISLLRPADTLTAQLPGVARWAD